MDALVTNRVWTAVGLDPATTLHDIRWGEHYQGAGLDDFEWIFMISGAAPLAFRWRLPRSQQRTPARHVLPLGGGTLKGMSKPGELVWSRVFVEGGRLHTVLHGVTRDWMMASHRANHISVACAPTAALADQAPAAKAAMLRELGIARVGLLSAVLFFPELPFRRAGSSAL